MHFHFSSDSLPESIDRAARALDHLHAPSRTREFRITRVRRTFEDSLEARHLRAHCPSPATRPPPPVSRTEHSDRVLYCIVLHCTQTACAAAVEGHRRAGRPEPAAVRLPRGRLVHRRRFAHPRRRIIGQSVHTVEHYSNVPYLCYLLIALYVKYCTPMCSHLKSPLYSYLLKRFSFI